MECSTEFPRPTGDDAVGGKDDILFVMFTSGTTEHPKMVAHNHLYPLGHYITAKYWHCNKPGEVHSQFQIQAGVRLSGVNFTDSGCARLAYSYLTLIHSAQTRYLSSLRSTISQHSAHLQHCTEFLSVWI